MACQNDCTFPTASACPGHNTHNSSEFIIHVPIPQLHDILLKVAPYFESCMIYLAKLNYILSWMIFCELT